MKAKKDLINEVRSPTFTSMIIGSCQGYCCTSCSACYTFCCTDRRANCLRSTKRQLSSKRQPGRGQQTAQLMLRIGPNIGLPDVVRSLGADPVKLMAEVGIDHELFDSPNKLISFKARGRLMAPCADQTSCPPFGLLVGRSAGRRSVGLAGRRST